MWQKIKLSSLALAFALIMSVTATESYAECASTEFQDMQKNFSSAQKVQDQAVTRQLQPQSDSTLVLTCFDQQMEVAAQAGEIFSDDFEAPLGVINPLIAAGSNFDYLLTGGMTNSLDQGIKTTVADFFQGMLDDFTGSLTSALSSTISGILGGFLGALGPILGGLLTGVDYDCANMQDLWDDNVIGQGINADSVFQDFDELMAGTATGAGTEFMDVLSNNSGVLDDALDDDDEFAAGTFEFQRVVPVFGGGATVADIIAGM